MRRNQRAKPVPWRITALILTLVLLLAWAIPAGAIDIPELQPPNAENPVSAPALKNGTGLRGNLTGWPEASGTWSITDAGLAGENLALPDQFFLSETQVTSDDAFYYEGDITLPKIAGQNAAGLVISGADGWYCVNVTRSNFSRMFKVGTGGWSAADQPMTEEQNAKETYHLRLEVENHQFRYYLDGVLINTYTDINFAGGRLGVVGHFSNATFQNLNKGDLASGMVSNITGWPEASGAWSITDAGLVGDNAGQSNNMFLSETEASLEDSFVYEANVTLPAGEGQNAAGLVISGAGGWYCINIDRSGGAAKLFKEGVWNADSHPLTAQQLAQDTFHLRLVREDGKLQYYLDSQLILEYSDPDFTGGRLGVVGHFSNATFNQLNYRSVHIPKLTSLEVEGVTFTEPFAPGRTRYLANVPADTDHVRVKMTAGEGMILSVDGREVQSGEYSDPISLNTGINRFQVKAVSPDQGFANTLTISIFRSEDRETGYRERFRSQFHFSNYQGYMNDPNGLVYNADTGEYHLYFQIDPDPDSMENWPSNLQREWGHAVSSDLVNWIDCGIVMEPDELGEIFSGCGVVDRENTSGLFDDSTPPDSRMVYIYTSTRGFVQSLAYSTDGGYTLTKYENNPVIQNPGGIYGSTMRDPKVIWHDGQWILTVGGVGHRYTSIFVSDNLIDWEFQSQIMHKDGSAVDTDCTDIFPMTVEGTGETKWVFSEAGNFYLVGELSKNDQGKYEFVAETEPLPFTATSADLHATQIYATQTFYNDAKDRRLAISWIQEDPGAARIWCGQQSLVWELGLKKAGDSYLLTSYPVKEFEAYRSDTPIFSDRERSVGEASANILAGVAGQKYDIEATIDPGSAAEFGFRLRQGNGHQLVVKYDTTLQKMVVDCSKTNAQWGRNWSYSSDLQENPDGTINLRLIMDTATIEAFGNKGEAVFAGVYYTEEENIGMEFYVQGGDVKVKDLNVYDVRAIYRDDQTQPTDTPALLSLSSSTAQPEPGEAFTVYANVLPYNVADKSVTWTYDDALTLVREDANSITLSAEEEGEYTVKAVTKAGGLEKEISIPVKRSTEHLFKTNLTGWDTSAGTWTYGEDGYTGNCPSGDNAAVSKEIISGDFTLEADVSITANHGYAAMGLVLYAQNVNASAAGAYIFNYDIGGQFFRFFRFPYKDIASISFADAGIAPVIGGTYHVKVICKDNQFTITVDDKEIFKDLADPDGPTYQSGRMGVLGHWADVKTQNYYVTTASPIASVVTVIPDIQAEGGTPATDILAQLPAEVTVRQKDGITKKVDVTWDISGVNRDKKGTYPISGVIAGTDVKASATIVITTSVPIPAKLTDLTLNSALLEPNFSADVTEYTAKVGSNVESIKVMPTYTGDTPVTVGGNEVASGTYSGDIALAVGENTITVVAGEKTYTITVTREDKEEPPVPVKPVLDGLELSQGVLNPAFDKDVNNYVSTVSNAVDKVRVKAVCTGEMKVTVNGKAVESGVFSDDIALAVGENVITVNLRLDGKENAYQIIVTRAKPEDTSKPPITAKPGKPGVPGGSNSDWTWPSGAETATGKENPKSGDFSKMPLALVILAGAAGTIAFVSRKRKK